MAVPAVDAKAGDVVLVTERHRLRFAHPGVCDVRRALELIQEQEQSSYHEDRTKE